VKRVHVVVSGRVQGVFFRATCEEFAVSHNLAGYARNLPDGRVEAEFEGPEAAVDAAVAWCRVGPPLALVDSVEVEVVPSAGTGGFRVV
jgi:acylphosphatase